MSKAVSWRIIGIILLYIVTYLITRDVVITTVITVLHHTAFVFIFYFHDRAWGEISFGWYVWTRAFTYEIVLGFLVLGVITFVVTGSWTQVTRITVIYLSIRYLLFPVHEWLYARRDRWRKTH